MQNTKRLTMAVIAMIVTAGCVTEPHRKQDANNPAMRVTARNSTSVSPASATPAPVERTMAPRPTSKQETARLTAEARRPRSVDEARKNVIQTEADVKTQCGGDIVTRITKVALLPTKDWIKLSRDSGAVPNAKYLVMYGVAKRKQSWSAQGPIVATATTNDFKDLIGKPICLSDPDVDND